MSFVDLGEVQLFFTDEGVGGPPMLFVHGYTCASHDWNWQLPHFESRHRVIAVDLTRPDFAIPVVRLVIPGLEWDPHHPNYRPGPRAQWMAALAR